MFDIDLDVVAATTALTALIDDTSAELTRHQQTVPTYPVAAAGKGFAAHGEALAKAYAATHDMLGQRISAALATSEAARVEVRRFASEDDGFAENIGGGY
ncbi:hypothetical protein [Corynebacterium epidermidicanis]|uniref:PE family protein n=1 Tax=Corynebacterium epidermidicanis TaxID=1050174 RepID=A0A0G3GMI0_9CORY|nr:hypothetical protein [Corynebacterium epidermidicanis]AKK02349.1 hypothetical protein CEPID_02340 [Corynebacterium epidermidicanis]